MIIDSHVHWGVSLTLGITVTTEEILNQADETGVDRIIIFPFPSAAIEDEKVNDEILRIAEKDERFIPYYYIPDDLRPIPKDLPYRGGKWHWVRGIQDSSSNYKVLKDPALLSFIEESTEIGLPIVFEEELEFTRRFVEMAEDLPIIIPHTGLLGGNPISFLETFKDNKNVYFDTALSSCETIKRFVSEVGAERVIFGSDIPFGSMREELSKVLLANLSSYEQELILSKNILRITKLMDTD